ncbi:hypothetical protein FJY63_10915 [Candidatus Sumerlaeota bacterium]|nr:hypothetical protein [Candidatus Sumerlaeota bacterium]
MIATDEKYLKIITDALAVCADYRPKFGHGRKGGLSLEQFQPDFSLHGLMSLRKSCILNIFLPLMV